MTTPNEALLLCPFCRGEASSSGVINYHHKHQAWFSDGTQVIQAFFCSCIACGASAKGLIGHQTREKAITAWNTRTSEAAIAQPEQPTHWTPEEITAANARAGEYSEWFVGNDIALPVEQTDHEKALSDAVAYGMGATLDGKHIPYAEMMLPVVPALQPLTDEQIKILRFLQGSHGIDGWYFGERHPLKGGRFWWRSLLSEAFPIEAALAAHIKAKD